MKVSAPNPVDIAQGLAVHIHSARDQLAPSADSHPLCKTKNYLRVVTTDEACFTVPALKRLFSLRKPLSQPSQSGGRCREWCICKESGGVYTDIVTFLIHSNSLSEIISKCGISHIRYAHRLTASTLDILWYCGSESVECFFSKLRTYSLESHILQSDFRGKNPIIYCKKS